LPSGAGLIHRVQRNAIVACLVMAAIAGVVTRDLAAPAGVLGGGLIVGISFLSIRGGVEDLAARRRAGLALLKLVGRYALLGFLAYVMIARLRLPPLALMAGASSVVAAAVVEAVRLLWTKNTKNLNR
jgi:hypothetical protein